MSVLGKAKLDMRIVGSVTGFIGLLFACVAPATAQDAVPPTGLRGIETCRAIAEDAPRLACFDAAAARLAAAIADKEVVILDQAEVQRTRRSLFGFSLPRLAFLQPQRDDGTDAPEFIEITSKIAAVRALPYGKWELTVDEAIWQTTEPLRFPPRAGANVRIRRGALGSFFLSINDGRSVRAMRVR